MPGLDFLKAYESKNTIRVYKFAIKHFLEVVYNQKLEYDDLDDCTRKYFEEKSRDYQLDITDFFISIKNKQHKTVRLFMAAVKAFFLDNGIERSPIFWKQLIGTIKDSRALPLDKIPSNVELKMILQRMPLHGKALYLSIATTGMRISEALQIRLEDLQLDLVPARLNIRGEYTTTGITRVAFISHEAREAIEEWLKIRSEYLKAASKKSWKYEKDIDDPRLFRSQI